MVPALTAGQPIWMNVPRSVYVHIPFCTQRCGYCNFSLITGREDLVPAFLDALSIELQQQTAEWDRPLEIETLFLGGGTPSYLNPDQREQLLQMLQRHFVFGDSADHEFSIEANPNDLAPCSIQHWVELGVNRFSLGVQSFDERKLNQLERTHQAVDVQRAAGCIKAQGAELSLDLIFAAPGETVEVWQNDLRQALECGPDHVSTYQLTFEKGTQFWNRLQKGKLEEVPDELAAEMYRSAIDSLVAGGFQHYEVSNFARPQCASRHNCVYWSGQPYLAFGPAAARYVGGQRLVNHGSTTTYIRRLLQGNDVTAQQEPCDPELRAREYFVFGMRMLRGVGIRKFEQETGFQLETLFAAPLKRDQARGLISVQGDRIQLTHSGLLVSDSMWPDYL